MQINSIIFVLLLYFYFFITQISSFEYARDILLSEYFGFNSATTTDIILNDNYCLQTSAKQKKKKQKNVYEIDLTKSLTLHCNNFDNLFGISLRFVVIDQDDFDIIHFDLLLKNLIENNLFFEYINIEYISDINLDDHFFLLLIKPKPKTLLLIYFI